MLVGLDGRGRRAGSEEELGVAEEIRDERFASRHSSHESSARLTVRVGETREFRHYLQRAKGRRILGHCFRRRPDSPALSAVFGSVHESVRPSRRTSNKSAAVDDVERVSHQPARRIARRPRALPAGLTPWLPSVCCTHRSQRRKPLCSLAVRRGDGVRAESAIRCLSHYDRWFACHRQPPSVHFGRELVCGRRRRCHADLGASVLSASPSAAG